MNQEIYENLKTGFETAYIDSRISSNLAFKPQFVSNSYQEGKKVLSAIEDELLACDTFQISVAFITMGGVEPLLPTLRELEKKGIMTSAALTKNKEWNTKIVSTESGEVAEQILAEYHQMWNSQYAIAYEDFIENYIQQYEIAKHQRAAAKEKAITSLEKYRLQPNKMQVGFITNLKKILASGEKRALLISATGTGKTYASAFAMRELGFKRVLFLVHRNQLAKQAKRSYENVFPEEVSMGIVGAGMHEYDANYVFATRDTLWREEHLHQYKPTDFDCIILDEAHHSAADTYQRIMNYFTPKLWLGMTATPDKRDDNIEGQNIYEIFHHQIAYEIRLQQAMEEDLLCPFHYFGISDLSMIGDGEGKNRKLTTQDFNFLVSDERVKHIIEQANYFGYSGERVKGLIFCSRIAESRELSDKFNKIINPDTGKYYRTIALNGDADENERAEAFERLAMDERDATDDMEPLDYIFSVEILNEGVDIVEVNQVIMLRPTQSPIVFIQQLGRGLRKADGKEFVVILDFIGNYERNFMIPIALSGDRTYNPDTIRKYVISGNNTIPGASTIHFDPVAKEKIFQSIDKIRGIKAIIKESYVSLKNRLGRVPYLLDFYENGEIDPLVIIREFKTYQDFLLSVEKECCKDKISDQEKLTLEYLSKTILSGVRPYELEILNRLFASDQIPVSELSDELKQVYLQSFDEASLVNAIQVLEGRFVSKEGEYQKYKNIEIICNDNDTKVVQRMMGYAKRLQNKEFCKQMEDLIQVGLRRYQDKFGRKQITEGPFVLYEKYSRRDISLLMNCGRDLSSIMYGMKRIGDDVFIFVTYHKAGAKNDELQYAEGKPDYADAFTDSMIFRWDSQIGKGPESSYMQDVIGAKRKHLLVKKSDAETSFYYMGTFDIISVIGDKKIDNRGNKKDITKVTMKMHQAVREDLLKYLESNLLDEEKKAI